MSKLQEIWDAIPLQIRTILNIGFVGVVLAVVAAVVRSGGVTNIDWVATLKTALDAGGLGVAVAVARALNPLDHAYGVNATSPLFKHSQINLPNDPPSNESGA